MSMKIGDMVRVVGPSCEEEKYTGPGWAGGMDQTIGNFGKIKKITYLDGESCFVLEESSWIYSGNWLTLVETEQKQQHCCTCPITTLLSVGCKCGQIEREREQ